MPEPRQRNIPLDINERQQLDQRKQDYESRTGDRGDWGKFLGVVTLAGLAALGIYKVAHATKREPTVWQVDCPNCSTVFPIQVPNPPPCFSINIPGASGGRGLLLAVSRPQPLLW